MPIGMVDVIGGMVGTSPASASAVMASAGRSPVPMLPSSRTGGRLSSASIRPSASSTEGDTPLPPAASWFKPHRQHRADAFATARFASGGGVAAHQRVGLGFGVGQDDVAVGADTGRPSIDRALRDRALAELERGEHALAGSIGNGNRVGAVGQRRDVARRQVPTVDHDHALMVTQEAAACTSLPVCTQPRTASPIVLVRASKYSGGVTTCSPGATTPRSRPRHSLLFA